jgi:hypothetical protein
MGHDRKLRRLVPVGAAALAVGGATIFAAPSSAAGTQAAKDDGKRCATLNLTDKITKWLPNEAVGSPVNVPVGFMTVWFGQAQSNDDPSLATLGVNGVLDIIAVDASTKTVTGYLTELLQFSDGGIRYSGAYNRTAAIAQQWITSDVIGISGVYAGMSGKVHWRITSVTDPAIPVEEHVFMCTHDPR